ncbi:MAG: virulence factor [Candidatus Methylacidiphilales bacterium]
MYAVTFDIDTNCLNDNYHGNNVPNAYGDIRKFMEQNNFIWMQGSVYFGNDKVDAVQCVLVVQRLAKLYSWFPICVRDIRMLRIEENNDLKPAIAL